MFKNEFHHSNIGYSESTDSWENGKLPKPVTENVELSPFLGKKAEHVAFRCILKYGEGIYCKQTNKKSPKVDASKCR